MGLSGRSPLLHTPSTDEPTHPYEYLLPHSSLRTLFGASKQVALRHSSKHLNGDGVGAPFPLHHASENWVDSHDVCLPNDRLDMADGPFRKACNRCHAQKLSCKRNGSEPCERCVRLNAECRSSPSLRFRKSRPRSSANGETSIRYRYKPQLDMGSGVSHEHFGLAVNTPSGMTTSLDHAMTSSGRLAGHIADESNQCLPTIQSDSTHPDHLLGVVGIGFGFGHGEVFAPDPNSPHLSHNLHSSHGVDALSSLMPHDRTAAEVWSSPSPSSPSRTLQPTLAIAAFEVEKVTEPYRQSAPLSSPRESSRKVDEGFTSTSPRFSRSSMGYRRIEVCPTAPSTMDTNTHLFSKVSELNTRVWDLDSRVPILAGSTPGTDTYVSEKSNDNDPENDPRFPMDEMFKLSRLLIQTLNEVYPVDSINSPRNSLERGMSASPRQSMDPATALLIISTYVRFLELFQKVFRLVRMEMSATAPRIAFYLCRLPDVSVGSFHVASTPTLQMVLALRLAEEFLSQLNEAMVALGHRLPSDAAERSLELSGPSMFSGVVRASLQELGSHEQCLIRELIELRTQLEASSGQ